MLALAMWLLAGVVYDFETTVVDARTERKFSGRVTVGGERYRVDLENGGVVISTDGDNSAYLYDAISKTWSPRKRHGVTRSSLLFQLPIPGSRVAEKPRVEYIAGGTEIVAGRSAARHTIEIDYTVETDVDGFTVRGQVRATVRIWADPTLPPLPMERDVRTGFERVDREISRVSSPVQGMILRHELDVSRSLDSGPVVTETTVTVTSNVAVLDVDDSAFELR